MRQRPAKSVTRRVLSRTIFALGLMMFAQLPPPYNEGLYRNVSVDMGKKGSLCNAQSPAPHMNCTTTPMETLTDAVRLAFEQAAPDKVSASWVPEVSWP